MPPKIDEEKILQNETSNATTPIPPSRIENNSPGFKTEHLLELQEKITKEILSTKLNENEMHALQVSDNIDMCSYKISLSDPKQC